MDDHSSYAVDPDDGFRPESVPESADTEAADSDRTVIAGPGTPDFLDLTGNEKLVAAVRRYAVAKYEQFKEDRRDVDDLEEDADYMWTSGVNSSIRAANQTADTDADTGSTLFYRQVRTLAAQTLGVALSSREPYRSNVLPNDEVEFSEEEARLVASQRNNLARYTRKVDNFWRKLIDLVTSNTKRGTSFLMCQWRRETAMRWVKTPRYVEEFQDDGGMERVLDGFDYEQRPVVVRDHPTWYQVPNANFYCDRHAGDDIQRHGCAVISGQCGIDDLWGGVREGYYNAEQVGKVSSEHLYQGSAATTGDDKRENQELSRGLESGGDDTRTGLYQTFDVWMKAPINAEGEWDEKKTVPAWHWFTFVGDIENGPCVRAQDNPDPDGEFPGVIINRNPDDHDSVYHVSDAAILRGNFNEATTRKNQLYDGLQTVNSRPLVAVRGEVLTSDLSYGPHKIVWVEGQNSVREMDVRDTSGTALQTLQYTDDDSNRAVGTDRPIVGEALGGRTSASEAQNIYEQAKQPHMITTRYVLGTVFEWWGRKEQRYWEVFGDPQRTLQINEGSEVVRADLGQIWGDFDIEVVAVDEFEENMVANQNLSFVLQAIVPNFIGAIEPQPFVAKILRHYKWNPDGLVKFNADADAENVARRRIAAMLELGEAGYESPQPGENINVHYRLASGERMRWQGSEQIKPNLNYLDLYINECKALLSQQQQQVAAAGTGQAGAGPGNQSVGEVTGNAIAADQGMAGGGNLPMSL